MIALEKNYNFRFYNLRYEKKGKKCLIENEVLRVVKRIFIR